MPAVVGVIMKMIFCRTNPVATPNQRRLQGNFTCVVDGLIPPDNGYCDGHRSAGNEENVCERIRQYKPFVHRHNTGVAELLLSSFVYTEAMFGSLRMRNAKTKMSDEDSLKQRKHAD